MLKSNKQKFQNFSKRGAIRNFASDMTNHRQPKIFASAKLEIG